VTRWFPDAMPQPMADNDTIAWWEAAAQHRLVAQRCEACARLRIPPAPLCPECRSDAFDWKELPGRAELYTYTVAHRPMAAGQELPFIIGVVELEGADGLRLVSNLVEIEPEALEIGMPLEVAWEDMSAELAIPRFRPASG